MKAKFPEYKGLDLSKTAEEILSYWKDNNIFEKSVTSRENANHGSEYTRDASN